MNNQLAITAQPVAIEEDPTPTQKIYGEIHDLDRIHTQAIADMAEGYRTGNVQLVNDALLVIEAATKAMPRMGSVARKYFLSKVVNRVQA